MVTSGHLTMGGFLRARPAPSHRWHAQGPGADGGDREGYEAPTLNGTSQFRKHVPTLPLTCHISSVHRGAGVVGGELLAEATVRQRPWLTPGGQTRSS